MRVNSVFDQLLDIPGASVSDVTITGADVEVRVRLRARTLTCECGYSTRIAYNPGEAAVAAWTWRNANRGWLTRSVDSTA